MSVHVVFSTFSLVWFCNLKSSPLVKSYGGNEEMVSSCERAPAPRLGGLWVSMPTSFEYALCNPSGDLFPLSPGVNP